MIRKRRFSLIAAALFSLAPLGIASADSGLYFGGGVGNAAIELDFQGAGFSLPNFDEDDFAWKLTGGYIVDLPVLDVGVELSYVDFGQPSGDVIGATVELDSAGVTVFGIAGLDVGPANVYGKLGYVSWDLDATISAVGVPAESVKDDGTDLAYGVGLRFGLASIEVRGDYEVFDIEDTEVGLISASLVYYFN